MEYNEIKKLMDDMGNSKLTELEIEFPDGIKISMKKEDGTIHMEKKALTGRKKTFSTSTSSCFTSTTSNEYYTSASSNGNKTRNL